jgi:hypothetical protein
MYRIKWPLADNETDFKHKSHKKGTKQTDDVWAQMTTSPTSCRRISSYSACMERSHLCETSGDDSREFMTYILSIFVNNDDTKWHKTVQVVSLWRNWDSDWSACEVRVCGVKQEHISNDKWRLQQTVTTTALLEHWNNNEMWYIHQLTL